MDQMTDEFFMQKALAYAEEALAAGEFPVGCVIADRETIRAGGFRCATSGDGANEIDHAEILALKALYQTTALAAPEKLTVYCTMEPCLMCFGAILISGIRRIVYAFEDVMGGGTGCDLSVLTPLYREKSVQVVSGLLRAPSLALFRQFFSRPENDYWKDSLLAEYTLHRA
jgi:tRNA(adenine34) deaminase